MAVDMFLKLDGIEGESSIKKHEGEIEVLSFSWGITNTGSIGGGGGGSGKATAKEFVIVKGIDAASPKLMEACCTGEHIREATLTLATSSAKGGQLDYMKIKLTDILISSYQTGGGTGGSVPMDQISFNFRSIDVQTAGGKGGSVGCDFSSIGKEVGHNHEER